MNRGQVEVYEFEPFHLDLVSRQLSINGTALELPPKTFDILLRLVENRGRLVPKEELMTKIWPGRIVEENNLTVRISWIRRTLREHSNKKFVETVSGHGYRFVGRVRVVSIQTGTSPRLHTPNLAVVPVINEVKNQRLNYLCSGLTEGLINALSRSVDLNVISHSAITQLTQNSNDVIALGKRLGVDAILIGHLGQRGSFLVLRMELVAIPDCSQIWGDIYEREAKDILDLQEDIVKRVFESLSVPSSRSLQQGSRCETDSVEAYHLYLKGLYFWNMRTTTAVSKSVRYLKRATSIDPRFVSANALLADAYRTLFSFGAYSRSASARRALEALDAAFAIEPRSPEGLRSLGQIRSYFDWDWIGAEESYTQALEINPRDALTRQYYSTLLAKLGRFDEAIREIQRAYEADPISLHIQLAIARTYYLANQYDVALRYVKEIVEIAPDYGPAQGIAGVSYLEKGLYDVGLEHLERFVAFCESDCGVDETTMEATKCEPDSEALGILGFAYGISGKTRQARTILRRLKSFKRRVVESHAMAMVHVGLNEPDEAFFWLEKAFAERATTLPYLKVWPIFRRISTDERFLDLVRRMGLGAIEASSRSKPGRRPSRNTSKGD